MTIEIITAIFVTIFGLIIGSFLNVCIYRIPREESISFPPSHCTNCNKKIKWYDLIPVISFMFLKGKCRNCGSKISIRYPLIETLNGILYLILYLQFGITLKALSFMFLVSLLIVVSLIDIDTTDVYFKTSLTGYVGVTLFIAVSYFTGTDKNFFNNIYGALLGGGFILLIYLLSRGRGMGLGDAEICAYCGAFLGLKLTVVMLFFSVVLGGIIGVLLILFKIKSRKDYIPFGPYIALGTLVAIFFGNSIISWYLGGL